LLLSRQSWLLSVSVLGDVVGFSVLVLVTSGIGLVASDRIMVVISAVVLVEFESTVVDSFCCNAVGSVLGKVVLEASSISVLLPAVSGVTVSAKVVVGRVELSVSVLPF